MPQLEYLTGNSLINYPFRDDVSLRDISLLFTLSSDCFLDSVICPVDSQAHRAYLARLEKDGLSVEFTINLLTNAGGALSSSVFVKPIAGLAEREVITASDAFLSLKIVPGRTLIDLLAGSDFSYDFTVYTTEFEASTVIPPVSTINSLKFYNASPTGSTLIADVSADDLMFMEGANIDFAEENGVSAWSVAPGLGSGLYDPCQIIPGVIHKINFLTTQDGKFTLMGDDCYRHELLTNGIKLVNTCTPKCTAEQINNFGHYHNRVKHGLFTVRDYAETIKDAIITDMNAYLATVVPTKRRPEFKATMTSTTDSSNFYFSFRVAMNNPSDAAILTDISTEGDNYYIVPYSARLTLDEVTCFVPIHIANYTVLDDAERLALVGVQPGELVYQTSDEATWKKLAAPPDWELFTGVLNNVNVTDYEIPCIKQAYLDFVVAVSVGVTTTLTITSSLYPNTKVYTLQANIQDCPQ